MKLFLLVPFLLLFVLHICFGQEKTEKGAANSKISLKDSLTLAGYYQKMGRLSIFSIKRQQYLDSALLIVPWNSQLWQQKAMPLFKQKKYELGMPFLDSAVAWDKTHHWLEYRAFIKCIFQKSYRESIEDFNAVQKLRGNSYVMDHTYEFYKGLCYLQLNEFDSAKYLISKCVNEEIKNRGESHHLHWFYLGIIQYEQGDYNNAIESLDNSIELYSKFSDAQFYKGLCLIEQNKVKQALEIFLVASENLQTGYTINEDNAMYEDYPYQLNKHMLKAYIESLQTNGR